MQLAFRTIHICSAHDRWRAPGALRNCSDEPREIRHVGVSAHARQRRRGRDVSPQGGVNLTHSSDPAFDTADFADTTPGNLRTDYVLPRRGLPIGGAGVFWPTTDDPLFRLVGVFPFPSSDHRLVWVDVSVPAAGEP